MWINKIHTGDCLDLLRQMDTNSIDCCITSPPYYNLRDYSHDGQIGLEKTPDEYIKKLVEVFSQIKRILKPEGTLWLNLGDSYVGGGGAPGSWVDNRQTESLKGGSPNRRVAGYKSKDLIGIPWMLAFALRSPQEEHLIESVIDRAYIAGLIDGEGCITILRTKSSHCDSYSYPPIVQVRMCDVEAIDYFAGLVGVNRSNAELYNSQKNANQRPSYTVKATAQKAMDLIADIYPYLHVKRKQAIIAYNHQLLRNETNCQPRPRKQIEKEEFCKEIINKLNQRELVDIPGWMIEPKFKIEPGWYLRQDCIWHKPNPMPESVKDRCTKAHEYIFLLSKSSKYYYNYEAMLEEATGYDGRKATLMKGAKKYKDSGHTLAERGHERWRYKNLQEKGQSQHTLHNKRAEGEEYLSPVRNKRSVWSISTKPFAGAHFATFPEELALQCLTAGCPPEGTVIDPFSGAGTVAVVAKKTGRQYIGLELNPEYVEIANKRLDFPVQRRLLQ